MQITVELPDDLAAHSNGVRAALEAFAIESYRSGALSPYQIRLLLGFETRDELNDFLKANEVWEHCYTLADLEVDRSAFAKSA